MRHTLLSGGLAAAFFLLASAFSPAAAREKGEYPIAGIWQMAVEIIDGAKVQVVRGPIFKILGEDGSMCNLNAMGRQAVLTQQGTYEMTGDSTYVENLLPSARNNFIPGQGRMKYRLEDGGRILRAQWFNEATGQWQPEMYVRVTLEGTK